GEVVTERLRNPRGANDAGSDSERLPGALIHHWVGAIFIPGASLPDVVALLQDYNCHKDYYAPQVLKSKTLSRSVDAFRVYLRLARTKVITVVLDTEYDVQYQVVDAKRALSNSYSTHIAEVESPGERGEHDLPPGDDHGFLWRLDSFWRFQEAEGGVYMQCEV